MDKFKVLGVALMVSNFLLIGGSYALGLLPVQVMASSTANFVFALGLLCVVLFSSFAALVLDEVQEHTI
jgi:hypothetical protein